MSAFLLPSEPIESLDAYLATDTGGSGVRRAHELGPAGTIDVVSRSGLRGRGGGGFPSGQKWAGVAAQSGARRYLVCNGAEGEPGTFKDRALLRANPYQLVEGMVIAAFAVGAAEAFICLKASFRREIDAVTRAVQEFQTAGICGDCKVTIVAGPDEYLFGEEKAMLEVIEGNEPLPRWLPPYLHGLFATAPQLGWQSHDNDDRLDAQWRRVESDARQQRRNPVEHPPHPGPRSGVVSFDGHRRVARHHRHDRHGRCHRSRCRRGRDGRLVARGDRRRRKRSGCGAIGEGGVLGRGQRRGDRSGISMWR